MTEEEFVLGVKGIVLQYEEGAINNYEMINAIFVRADKATREDWYQKGMLEIQNQDRTI